MRRFVLFVLLSLSLIIPAHAQGFDETLAAIDPAEIGLVAEDIQNFAATMRRVPERGRERHQSAFTQLSSDVQALVLRTHARFATGEERPDIALAVSTTNLYFQIQGLITYIEEDVWPESGQLPDAVAQLDRLYRNRPEIEQHLGAGFRAQVEEIQQMARAAYEERLAAERAETAESERALAESERSLAESERSLAESERSLAESERSLAESERELARWKDAFSQMTQMLQEMQ